MSWGALPWWVYESMYQREMMRQSGAMIEELYSGMPQAMAEHTWSINSSVFATHEPVVGTMVESLTVTTA